MKALPLVFLLVGVGFLLLGGYLLTAEDAMNAPNWMRMALGGLLVIYGIFRLSTSIVAMKKNSAG
jgi:uncharacterized protein (DUF983 family)